MIIFPAGLRTAAGSDVIGIDVREAGLQDQALVVRVRQIAAYDRFFQPSWPLPVASAVALMNDEVASFAFCSSSATRSG